MIAWWWLIVAFVGGIISTIAVLFNPFLNLPILWVLSTIMQDYREEDASEDKSGSVED